MKVGDMHRTRDIIERKHQLLDTLDIPRGDVRRLESTLQSAHMRLMVGEDPSEVLRQLRAVKSRAEAVDLPHLVARAWRWIALCEDRQGRRREAVDCCRRAVEIARDEADNEAAVQSLLQRGWLEQLLGELDAAERHLRQARQWSRTLETPYREFQARHHLAWLALARGNVEEAVDHFEAVLDVSRTHGYRRLEMRCLNGLGEVARFQGDAPEARRCYRRYRRANQELNLPDAVATADLNLAQVELMAGRFDEAADRLARSAGQFEKLAGKSGQIHLIRMARMAWAAGTGRWETYDDIWRHYRDGWPEGGSLVTDHPWLLEMAGGYAAEADKPRRARGAWRLARDLWMRLDDREAVERLEGRLE